MSCLSRRAWRDERGFSLIEVVLVVLIMGILSAVAAQKWGGAMEQQRFEATRTEMDNLATAIVGNPDLTANGVRTDFGYVGDVGALPASLDALVSNPGGFATWNGPYIQNDFTQNPNDYKQDAWGAGYAYSGGVSLTSNGSGSAVTKRFASSAADLTGNSVVGSVTDGRDNPPGDSSHAVNVSITFPNGSGTTTTASMATDAGGSYSFSGSIPVGNHEIMAAYQSDTLRRYVSVLPKSTAYVSFRLPGDLWTPAASGGGGGGAFTYVSGTATSWTSGRHMRFTVANNSGAAADITSLVATYSPAVFFERIRIGGTTVFNSTNPRGASGDTVSFSAQTVPNGGTAIIRFLRFKQCVSGNCANGDVRGTDFTVVFNDGSSVSFSVP